MYSISGVCFCIRKRNKDDNQRDKAKDGKILQGAKLTPKSPHKARRTYGSILLDNNVDERMVTDLRGHTDIRCTEGYYHKNRGSIDRNLRKHCKIGKKIKLMTGIEPVTSALPRRRSTDWATSAITLWSVYLPLTVDNINRSTRSCQHFILTFFDLFWGILFVILIVASLKGTGYTGTEEK